MYKSSVRNMCKMIHRYSNHHIEPPPFRAVISPGKRSVSRLRNGMQEFTPAIQNMNRSSEKERGLYVDNFGERNAKIIRTLKLTVAP